MGKKPRLFYFDEGVEAFIPCPIPDDDMQQIIDVHCMDAEEKRMVEFKRLDLTDEELMALPEAYDLPPLPLPPP